MKDIEIILENRPGVLALLGETLGKNNISLEGGAVFANGSGSIAHFLVADGNKAMKILNREGFTVASVNKVLVQKLKQDVPGQLGMFCRRIASAGINIITQYSDHYNQLILVVDDHAKAMKVSEEWMKEWWP